MLPALYTLSTIWRRIPTMALRPEGYGDSQGDLPDEWSI